MQKIIVFIALFAFISCSSDKQKSNNGQIGDENLSQKKVILETKPQESSKFIEDFTKKVNNLISKNEYVSFSQLQQQKLKNIEENSNVKVETSSTKEMTGNELYFYLKERTLVTGLSFKGQFDALYLSPASAYVISSDGVIATNYHVVDVHENMETMGIFVADKDGNVYPVIEVLSSSQANDLAILRIETKGKKLKVIPFAKEELMGEDIYMMGHPFRNTFFMSKGIIARKYISERDSEPRIGVTVDYGQGASGGAIVNTKGELVGMVSSTYMERVNGNGAVQMVVKEAIPVSTLWKYVKK